MRILPLHMIEMLQVSFLSLVLSVLIIAGDGRAQGVGLGEPKLAGSIPVDSRHL